MRHASQAIGLSICIYIGFDNFVEILVEAIDARARKVETYLHSLFAQQHCVGEAYCLVIPTCSD
jgi:hypothetical protein